MNKRVLKAQIEILTGLHIGGGGEFSAIGAVDSPVVRDSLTKQPIIPGSSIKGKLRYLLQRELNGVAINEPNRDQPEVLRLFGSSEKNNIQRARLKFNDCFFNEENLALLNNKRVAPTEIKYENTINRTDSQAMPRQIERVIRGSLFDLELFYQLDHPDELMEDFENIKLAFDLLSLDYLGGHGTRGSGRVRIVNVRVAHADGSIDTELQSLFE